MEPIVIAFCDPDLSQKIKAALKARSLACLTAENEKQLLDHFNTRPVDLAFIKIGPPDGADLGALTGLKERRPNCRLAALSGDQSVKAALNAVRAGGDDYLPLPLDEADLEECLDRLEKGLDREAAYDLGDPSGPFTNIIGRSQSIRTVFKLVEKVAATDSTVMIYGESGTGKELVAKAIHQNSHRRDNPLIPVNCAAIPEELLESELFGHEKGSFTSAVKTRIGRFEMSDGGTFFLDEVADMSPKLQVKILRVLQEHQFERIGGAKTINVDVRVITATNKNLRQAVEEGRFREDLFYRLNVIPITVPPLRERAEDIPLLVSHFIERHRESKGGQVRGVEPEAMNKLKSYPWPGNIRELENIIERMMILAEGEMIAVADLPPRISEVETVEFSPSLEISEDGIDFNQVVSDFENQLLIKALEQSGWVKNKAAQLLKLNRTTLVEKLKKKKIFPPEP